VEESDELTARFQTRLQTSGIEIHWPVIAGY